MRRLGLRSAFDDEIGGNPQREQRPGANGRIDRQRAGIDRQQRTGEREPYARAHRAELLAVLVDTVAEHHEALAEIGPALRAVAHMDGDATLVVDLRREDHRAAVWCL